MRVLTAGPLLETPLPTHEASSPRTAGALGAPVPRFGGEQVLAEMRQARALSAELRRRVEGLTACPTDNAGS